MSNFFNDKVKEEIQTPISKISNPFIEKTNDDVVVEVSEPILSSKFVSFKEPIVEKLSNVKYNEVDIMQLNNISQIYDNGKSVIFNDFNLRIKDIVDRGQFITILGQSGCGKCFSKDSFITIRNKKTQKLEKIEANDFIKRLRQPI